MPTTVPWDLSNPCYGVIDGLVGTVADRVGAANCRQLEGPAVTGEASAP